MSEPVPDWAKVWLDPDVAQFLHQEAELHYDGDVSRALNETLRSMMTVMYQPDDPWAVITAQVKSRRK